MNSSRTWFPLVVALASVVGLASAQTVPDAVGNTLPSQDVILSFVNPGQIATVLVTEGDVIEAGQALVQQDDEAEQIQLAQLKADVETQVHVAAAKAQLDQRRVVFERTQIAHEKGAANDLELEEARLDVTIAELSLDLRKFEKEQAARKYQEYATRVDRMTLKSPFDGQVEEVFLHDGESVDKMVKVIRLIRIDPLWLDAPVPATLARQLTVGQEATVIFPGSDGFETSGRIRHIAGVGDSASDRLMVRVEVSNPTRRPAGEQAHVRFSVPGQQAPAVGTAGQAPAEPQS